MDKTTFDYFCSLENLSDVASLIGFKKGALAYLLYAIDRDSQYTTFSLPKKNGGERIIETPTTALKTIQRRLKNVLTHVYLRRPSAFGFINNLSIRDNAQRHCKKKFVFNLDLKDFFHSIHFGRVRGLFAARPYSLPLNVSTIIAQICCCNGRLPQGAPTSPIISNMVASKLDYELQNLAKDCRCHYTRYADDITFSSNSPRNIQDIWKESTPSGHIIASLNKIKSAIQSETVETEIDELTVGDKLQSIITDNGFTINHSKVRLSDHNQRQVVTGLVVNRFPNVRREYIRDTRAIIHSWRTKGIDAATEKFYIKHKGRKPNANDPALNSIVRGRIEYIGMVKGKKNDIYLKLLRQFYYASHGKIPKSEETRFQQPLLDQYDYVITEGKTDWKHIEAAIASLVSNKLIPPFSPQLYKYEDNEPSGDTTMLDKCKTLSKTNTGKKRIFVFDNDNKSVFNNATDKGNYYKNWGNNVFSTVLPVPEFRNDPNISIEFLYKDKDLYRADSAGRRLYTNSEFNSDGTHRLEKNIEFGIDPKTGNITKKRKNGLKPPLKILDSEVVRISGKEIESIALSKDAFASNILARTTEFQITDFEGFIPLIERINKIMDL